MTGKIILIALVTSETRTTQGLLTLFEKRDYFGIDSEVFIIMSVIFSMTTFSLAQTLGIAGSRIYNPLAAKVLIGLSALLACAKRVMTYVKYFSPCLGLWNLLRHYQAEQIGFYKTNAQLASPTDVGDRYVPQIIDDVTMEEVEISGKNISLSLIQRGNWLKSNTTSFMEYVPPNLEEHYTILTIKEYFIVFWCLWAAQSLTIMIAKYYTSDQFKNLNWYDKVFHTMECINFAFPFHDWDHEGGDGRQHYLRMLAARREVKINSIINTIFNVIFLFPLPVLYYSISLRHHFLLESKIGTLPLENQAYNQAWISTWLFPLLTLVASALQYLCFHFYNERYHPMARILEEYRIEAEGEENQENEPIEVSSPDLGAEEDLERPQETIASQEVAKENPEAPDPQDELEPTEPSKPSEPLESPEQPLKLSEIP